ncbi:MAG: hypothetical protein ACRCVY_00995 [Commensalibacter sp.]|nr:hypothetical protein [Commensalibacter sp.]
MVIQTNSIYRKCERSVITAYKELREAGIGEVQAFKSCTTLYRIHHPESSINEARRLVSEWIDHHVHHHTKGSPPDCRCN